MQIYEKNLQHQQKVFIFMLEIVTNPKLIRIIAKCLTKIIEFMIRKIVLLTVVFFTTTSMVNDGGERVTPATTYTPQMELLYDNVWGTIYHADTIQCDSTPTITGDGSRINPNRASEHRWIAISQEILNDEYRASLVRESDPRFKGKIQYGDTIWVDSPYPEINGWWVARDAKNSMYSNSIDFLQTAGDGGLYNDSKYWSGKFKNIKIYRVENYKYVALQKSMFI